MSANGTESELFIEDKRVEALSCYNGWLYYSSGGRILQTNIYTKRSDLLCDTIPGKLYVLGEKFFIHAENGLYELKPASGEQTFLNSLPDCKHLSIPGDSLYYIDSKTRALYRSELNGENLARLTDEQCESFCLYGDYIFCTLNDDKTGRLVRMSLNGDGAITLSEARASLLNISEEGIFFLDKSEGVIKRLSFDGRIQERISGNIASDFNIAGGWIFYHNKGDGDMLWCVRIDGSNDHPLPNWR